MRPNKKKAGSGQATGNNVHSLGANNGHCSQNEYKGGYRDSQPLNVYAFCRKAQRAIGDCFVLLKSFPSCIRHCYFVGSDGEPFAGTERRAGA